MPYLLDTNAWIHYLKHANSPVQARLRKTPVQDVAVCSIVWAELLHGTPQIGYSRPQIFIATSYTPADRPTKAFRAGGGKSCGREA